jgi:hypothetical protein
MLTSNQGYGPGFCNMPALAFWFNDAQHGLQAGEASTDTVALVKEFLRLDPDLARTVEALRASPLPELPVALRPTQEKETLNMTKQLLRWRGILMGFAIFLTMLPLSFRSDNAGSRMFLQEMPPQQRPRLSGSADLLGWLLCATSAPGTGL